MRGIKEQTKTIKGTFIRRLVRQWNKQPSGHQIQTSSFDSSLIGLYMYTYNFLMKKSFCLLIQRFIHIFSAYLSR